MEASILELSSVHFSLIVVKLNLKRPKLKQFQIFRILSLLLRAFLRKPFNIVQTPAPAALQHQFIIYIKAISLCFANTMSFTFYVYCTYYIPILLLDAQVNMPGYTWLYGRVDKFISNGVPLSSKLSSNCFDKETKTHTHSRSLLIQSQLCCGNTPLIFDSYIR